MLKTYEAKVELNMDASRHDTIRVRSNTEKKARKAAVEAAKKKHNTNLVFLESIKEVEP